MENNNTLHNIITEGLTLFGIKLGIFTWVVVLGTIILFFYLIYLLCLEAIGDKALKVDTTQWNDNKEECIQQVEKIFKLVEEKYKMSTWLNDHIIHPPPHWYKDRPKRDGIKLFPILRKSVNIEGYNLKIPFADDDILGFYPARQCLYDMRDIHDNIFELVRKYPEELLKLIKKYWLNDEGEIKITKRKYYITPSSNLGPPRDTDWNCGKLTDYIVYYYKSEGRLDTTPNIL